MTHRVTFFVVLLLGLATAIAWHAGDAISVRDGLMTTAALDGGVTSSPPAPVSTQALNVGYRVVRMGYTETSPFRAIHLSAGLWLALAAALTALVAARAGTDGSRWTGRGVPAALFAGAAVLFGAETGRLGLIASPIAVWLALLAGSALAYVSERPRPFWGGLLFGLAVAEHPLTLFLGPAFATLSLGAAVRVDPARGGRSLIRSLAGTAVGVVALFLPVWTLGPDALLQVGRPDTYGRALAAWWGNAQGPFWSFTGPAEWGAGALEVIYATWRAAGPLGFVVGLAGLAAFFQGQARLVRPFLLAVFVLGLAMVFGNFQDPAFARAILGWCFVLWTVPTLTAAWDRVAGSADPSEADARRADGRAPLVALLCAGLMFWQHAGTLDRSDFRDDSWANFELRTAPENALLLTANPAHLAYAATGLRPDLDLVYLPEPTSLQARRTGEEFVPIDVAIRGPRVRSSAIQRIISTNRGTRPVLMDAASYFDPSWKKDVLAGKWSPVPQGASFRLLPLGGSPSLQHKGEDRAAWDATNTRPPSPASPLRDGLSAGEWFARAVLQSAANWQQAKDDVEAEERYLIAASHPDASPNATAIGLARIYFDKQQYIVAAETLETLVQDDETGAWTARRILGMCYLQLEEWEKAVATLEAVLPTIPAAFAEERRSTENALQTARLRGGRTGRPRP